MIGKDGAGGVVNPQTQAGGTCCEQKTRMLALSGQEEAEGDYVSFDGTDNKRIKNSQHVSTGK